MSSRRASFQLRLTAAQTGADPRTHYWFKADSNIYERLCDGDPWMPRRRVSRPSNKLCWRCKAIHADDRDQGLRAFRVTHRQKGIFAYESVDTCNEDEETMVHVRMKRFARFCVASAEDRVAMFVQSDGRDYYASLRKHLREQHQATDDLNQLALSIDALNNYIPNLTPSKRDTYRGLIQQYVEQWREQQASAFAVPTVRLAFGELSVRVAPEIGMQYHPDAQVFPRVLHLWFEIDYPSLAMQDVFFYLLGEALRDTQWTPGWRLGIWDVRRQQFIDRRPSSLDMEDRVHAAAAEYLRLHAAR